MAIVDKYGRPFTAPERSTGDSGRRNPYGYNLNAGGLMNPVTGLGTGLDKTEASFYYPTRFYYKSALQILCVQSWAAANFIDYPIDDMFIRWRNFESDDTNTVEAMVEAELKHDVRDALRRAMKAGRQYGTGLLVMMTNEAPLEIPLNIDQIRPGDLANLLVVDRYDCSVHQRDDDLFSPNYGKPIMYDIHPEYGGQRVRVHASRTLRFEGIVAPSDSGLTYYHKDWGVSRLTPVIKAITQDQALASAIAHLSQEASIPVLAVSNLRATLAGRGGNKEATAEQIGGDVNRLKSNHRLMMLDKEDEEFSRIAVQFGGLAHIMDRFNQRVAAAGRIPQTRWMGQPPVGMNATGDSDNRNYIMMVEAMRDEQLMSVLKTLDMVLAKDAGIKEAPEYKFQSLMEMSEKEIADVSKTKVEAASAAIASVIIDEDEAREALNGDPFFGELTGDAPEVEDPEPDLDDMPPNNPED